MTCATDVETQKAQEMLVQGLKSGHNAAWSKNVILKNGPQNSQKPSAKSQQSHPPLQAASTQIRKQAGKVNAAVLLSLS